MTVHIQVTNRGTPSGRRLVVGSSELIGDLLNGAQHAILDRGEQATFVVNPGATISVTEDMTDEQIKQGFTRIGHGMHRLGDQS